MFDLVLSQSRMNALEDAHNALIKIKNSEDLKVYKKDFTKLKKEEKVKREGEDKNAWACRLELSEDFLRPCNGTGTWMKACIVASWRTEQTLGDTKPQPKSR
jgi:hypothetical protein